MRDTAVRTAFPKTGQTKRQSRERGRRRPPQARLFGGDIPRGGKPMGIGHAGGSAASGTFMSVALAVLLACCPLAMPTQYAHATVAGKLEAEACRVKEALPDLTPGIQARGPSELRHQRIPLLLVKAVSAAEGGADPLGIRLAAISGASVAAISTFLSLQAENPAGRRKAKRRVAHPRKAGRPLE